MLESLILMFLMMLFLVIFGNGLANILKTMKPENAAVVVFLLIGSAGAWMYSFLFYGMRLDNGMLEPVSFGVEYLKTQYALLEAWDPMVAKASVAAYIIYLIMLTAMLYKWHREDMNKASSSDQSEPIH